MGEGAKGEPDAPGVGADAQKFRWEVGRCPAILPTGWKGRARGCVWCVVCCVCALLFLQCGKPSLGRSEAQGPEENQ